MFGLKPKHIDAINQCFAQYPQIEQVIIYGSRAKGNYKIGSDIDLTIEGDLDYNSLLKLENQLDDLLLPYKIDLSLKHKITNPDLLEHIERVGKVFYEKKKQMAVQELQVDYGKKSCEWKAHRLGDITNKISSGATPRGGKEAYLERGEYSLVRSQNILDFSFSKTGLAFISEEQASNLKNVEIEEKDVLLNITGDSVARVCQVPNDVLPARVNQHVAIIRGKNQIIDQKFLKYYLLQPSFKKYMLGLASAGATRNALTKSMIENFEIQTPDLSTQRRIASILSSLDEKIELNLQMNQTLEAMAQAIFKEWFVPSTRSGQRNFNFPGFDGELVGGLPKGWRKGNVLEIATLLSGGTPKTSEADYWDGEINWISAKDITSSNNQFIIETEKTITELGIKRSAAKLLPTFTTIISARGTVGNFCILPKEMAISQSNYGLKSNSDFDFFLFLLVKNMISMMKAFSYGAVFDTITTKTFEAMEITIPENQVIKEFEKFIKPIYSKILTNQLQIQTLTQTRNTLLPKLMSGKIEVAV